MRREYTIIYCNIQSGERKGVDRERKESTSSYMTRRKWKKRRRKNQVMNRKRQEMAPRRRKTCRKDKERTVLLLQTVGSVTGASQHQQCGTLPRIRWNRSSHLCWCPETVPYLRCSRSTSHDVCVAEAGGTLP